MPHLSFPGAISAWIYSSIVGSLLLSGCQSRDEARDEMLAQQLSAEIEGGSSLAMMRPQSSV